MAWGPAASPLTSLLGTEVTKPFSLATTVPGWQRPGKLLADPAAQGGCVQAGPAQNKSPIVTSLPGRGGVEPEALSFSHRALAVAYA